MHISVVMTWDGRNPGWLGEAVRSVHAQEARRVQRCLVVDAADGPGLLHAAGLDPLLQGWAVCHGQWSDPSAARNAGMEATTASWLLFWDGDDVMPGGFLRAVDDETRRTGPAVGIVYSDLQYVDENLQGGFRWHLPEYDYWRLRSGNVISTASAWRREAVELAGGWPLGLGAFEDWALALAVTRRGWSARHRGGPPVLVRQHGGSRSSSRPPHDLADDVWRARSLGVLSLLSGRRSTFPLWREFLRTAELPPEAALYVVDDSDDPAFTALVRDACAELGEPGRFARVSLTVRHQRYGGSEDEPYFVRERHLRVAGLYAHHMGAAREDLLLTLEDDVVPPPDAIRRLAAQLRPDTPVAAVAGAYDMGGDALCCGRADGGWGSPVFWSDLTDDPIEVGCVGGGCTLWAGWALAATPVPFRWYHGLGWDGSLCTAMRERGHTVLLHGGVRCVHHVHGALRA